MARRAAEDTLAIFDNTSIDLIYARPGQPTESWKTELSDALSLGAPHLSLYELTIAERTAFGKRAERGELVPMPDDDRGCRHWRFAPCKGPSDPLKKMGATDATEWSF